MHVQLPIGLRILALCIGALIVAGTAAPDAESVPNLPPDIVTGLVVQAATPGPAWWKVTNGSSTVWILGTP
ncbi:MAG: hypothetical protein JWM33_3607, partial [Caulobacteraceae bacterium]|nr:hypothetical protein [Caulobacteraceae bacterium]